VTGAFFRSDHERLADCAGRFTQLAAQAGEIAAALRQVLDDTGECWGQDPAGRAFAAAHTAPATDALERLTGLADRLGEVGSRFAATARTYQQADQAGVAELRATGR